MKSLVIEKPWGRFERFTYNELSTVKLLYIKKGESLSLQYHNKRNEFWKIVNGNPLIEIDGRIINARPLDEFEIQALSKHRISAPNDDVVFLEIATGEFDEDDIIRLEDKYSRIKNEKDK